MSCEEAFMRTLRERGMRMTPQREMVLSALHELTGHGAVEDIYRRVQVRSSAVDPSTVYRTLELLDELGMLATLEGADGQRRYALAGAHGAHVHLVCASCGQELTAGMAEFEVLATALQCRYGFKVDLGRLSMAGVCAGCAENQAGSKDGD